MTAHSRNLVADPTREFRTALGRFPTGVAFASTYNAAGKPIGMLVNSFTSVSLEPRLVSWCIARTASAYDDFLRSGRYAISFLAETQSQLLRDLCRPSSQRMDGIDLRSDIAGCPVPKGVVCWFQCDLHDTIAAGDHDILIGEVSDFAYEIGAPMGYLSGRSCRVEGQAI